MDTRVFSQNSADLQLKAALQAAGDRARAAHRQMQIILDDCPDPIRLDDKNLFSILLAAQQHFEDAALALDLARQLARGGKPATLQGVA